MLAPARAHRSGDRQRDGGKAEEVRGVLVRPGGAQQAGVEEVAGEHVKVAGDRNRRRLVPLQAEGARVPDVRDGEQRGDEKGRGQRCRQRSQPTSRPAMAPRQEHERRRRHPRQVERPVHAAQALRDIREAGGGGRAHAGRAEEAQESQEQEREPRVREDLEADQLVDVPRVEGVYDAAAEGRDRAAGQLAAEEVHAESGQRQREQGRHVVREHEVAGGQGPRRREQRGDEEMLREREAAGIGIEAIRVEQMPGVARDLVQHPADGPHVERRGAEAEHRVRRSPRERPGGDDGEQKVGRRHGGRPHPPHLMRYDRPCPLDPPRSGPGSRPGARWRWRPSWWWPSWAAPS